MRFGSEISTKKFFQKLYGDDSRSYFFYENLLDVPEYESHTKEIKKKMKERDRETKKEGMKEREKERKTKNREKGRIFQK